MGPLAAAFVLATPVFGLQLSLDLSLAPPVAAAPRAALAAAPVAVEEGGGGGEESPAGPTVAEQMQERARLAKTHRALGIATWSSMTMTMVLGMIQYHNLYGFFDSQDGNPCVRGEATFGQDQCYGTPWVHLGSAMLTTALYSATFALSLRMPDPMGLDQGDSEYARNLRTHKLLRWIHLGGMLSQFVLGIVVANAERFGLDRANDYRALQRLSTVHMATGFVTYGSLTAAGLLMLF